MSKLHAIELPTHPTQTNSREADPPPVELDGSEDYFALLGHELRNPLSAMVCAIEVIKLGDRERGSAVEILERQARQLEQVIAELVDGARRRSEAQRRCEVSRRGA